MSKVNSLTVGLEQLGSFVAAVITYPITTHYGRKYVIMGSTALFIVGAIIQTINTGSLGAWYFARIISGLGMGGQSVVVPMYSAEMTPKEIRGRCGSFYQWMYTWGILIAYWVDYVSTLLVHMAARLRLIVSVGHCKQSIHLQEVKRVADPDRVAPRLGWYSLPRNIYTTRIHPLASHQTSLRRGMEIHHLDPR